jgi:hypothetical protein
VGLWYNEPQPNPMCFAFVLNKATRIDVVDDQRLDDYQTHLGFNTNMALLVGILVGFFKIELDGHHPQLGSNGLCMFVSPKLLMRLVIIFSRLELV